MHAVAGRTEAGKFIAGFFLDFEEVEADEADEVHGGSGIRFGPVRVAGTAGGVDKVILEGER